jgi:hypothetical protein
MPQSATEGSRFTDEDRMFPVYCSRCKAPTPRAELDERYLCAKCREETAGVGPSDPPGVSTGNSRPANPAGDSGIDDGRPIGSPAGPQQTRKQVNWSPPPWAGITVAVIAVVAIAIGVASDTGNNEFEARQYAHNEIRALLLIPEAADFGGWLSEERIVKRGDSYTIYGTVNSKNAFGVMIPHQYMIGVTWVSKGVWRTTALLLDGVWIIEPAANDASRHGFSDIEAQIWLNREMSSLTTSEDPAAEAQRRASETAARIAEQRRLEDWQAAAMQEWERRAAARQEQDRQAAAMTGGRSLGGGGLYALPQQQRPIYSTGPWTPDP